MTEAAEFTKEHQPVDLTREQTFLEKNEDLFKATPMHVIHQTDLTAGQQQAW